MIRNELGLLLAASLIALTGWACSSGGGGGDDQTRAKMAGELVQCQNEKSSLRDQIAELKAEVAKLKVAADQTQHLDPIDVKAGSGGAPPVVHREGNLPPEAALQVLKTNSSLLRACYEKGLKRSPNLQYITSISVRFSVKNTGTAIGIGFAPRTDAEMEQCMATAMAKWRFPTFTGDPVQFEAPVNLIAK